ncbi:MAG: dodecin family protein [Pseudomonadota bacterium]
MSVASISEISVSSEKSFEDAISKGVERASKTVRNLRSAWVKDQVVIIDEGKVKEYRVKLKISFELE